MLAGAELAPLLALELGQGVGAAWVGLAVFAGRQRRVRAIDTLEDEAKTKDGIAMRRQKSNRRMVPMTLVIS